MKVMNKYTARKRRGFKSRALILKSEKARLVVSRSNVHISCQLVIPDKLGDKVLASCSTNNEKLRGSLKGKCKLEQASMVGKLLGEQVKKQGITEVAFDRAGYKYHGRVRALAEGVREAGLVF
jgi:large subunit ribosomal protein L18